MLEPTQKYFSALDAVATPPIGDALKSIMKPTVFERLNESNSITVPPPIRMPKLETHEEANAYQSAQTIVRNLGNRITEWNEQLGENETAAILAILPGGLQIDVHSLTAEGHDGLLIRGQWDGNDVMATMHKSNFVTLCVVVKSEPEKPRPEIGFHYQIGD
jgi:hypothetical protein